MSNDKLERPDFIEDEHLEFLDDLRESGQTNMFGATPYLIEEFGFSRQHASQVLSYWMKSFSDRSQPNRNPT